MITRENYELFYMDYLEGDLEPKLAKELEAFLDVHPDLKVDEDFLDPLETPKITFDNKKSLKFESIPSFSKMDNEEKIIAYHEGVLSSKEEKELLTMIKNDRSLQSLFEGYAKVFLQSNELEVFDSKGKLKKRESIAMWPVLMMVAASLLVFLLLNWDENGDSRYASTFSLSSDDLKEQLKSPEEGFQFMGKVQNSTSAKVEHTKSATHKVERKNGGKSSKEFIEYNLEPKKLVFNPSQQNKDLVAFNKVKLNTNRTNEDRALHSESKMENVLPPVLNYAVSEISNNKVSLKKEENKKLFSGRVRFKIGSFEIAKN